MKAAGEIERIIALIREADGWRRSHKGAGRHIEAAACAIRIAALQDAIDAIQHEKETER